MPSMNIDIAYNPQEDRIRLLVHGPRQPTEWWLTRRVCLRLLVSWAERLEAQPMPAMPATPWTPSGGPNTVAEQHALLMDVQPPSVRPVKTPVKPPVVDGVRRVKAVSLSVRQNECLLDLTAVGDALQLRLSRQELHSLLEALSQAVQRSGWLAVVDLPDWLGRADAVAPAPGGAR